MDSRALGKMVDLATVQRRVLVATAGGSGLPHLAAAEGLTRQPDGRLCLRAWFCPVTLTNLHENRQVALVVWDPRAAEGYQLFGEVEETTELAMLNGFSGPEEFQRPLPQVQRQLVVRPDRLVAFTGAPHDDQDL